MQVHLIATFYRYHGQLYFVIAPEGTDMFTRNYSGALSLTCSFTGHTVSSPKSRLRLLEGKIR